MIEPAKPLACPWCQKDGAIFHTAFNRVVACPDPECPGHSVDATEHEWNTRAADPRLAELVQEHATLRYSLAELRAIADQLRTDLELLTLAETQRRTSIIDLTEWKARNPE